MNYQDLERQLAGASHANITRIARENFTPDFLQTYMHKVLSLARLRRDIPINYRPSELDKCVIHYCTRNIMDDLWKSSAPTFGRYLNPDGRFNLDKALATNQHGRISSNIVDNLEMGRYIIFDITTNLVDDWIEDLGRRDSQVPSDLIPKLYTIYKLHSILINGDWEDPTTILAQTFTLSGKEMFDWLIDYPNLNRKELEEITENSVSTGIQQAGQLSIRSTAVEQVVKEAVEGQKLAYILDPKARKIIFNPIYQPDVIRFEGDIAGVYFDQTKLLLGCPAMFTPPRLGTGKSMLHELIKFRYSVFTELYLATHHRR